MATRHVGGDGARPIGESVRVLERDTQELLVAIEQLGESVNAALREQLDQRPYAALAAGFVAGYVLGGGVSLRLATMLAATAGRMALARLMTPQARRRTATPSYAH